MPARDYASTRFSPLDQINASNVGKLQAASRLDVLGRDAAWTGGPPLNSTVEARVPMTFDISMGVRRTDKELKAEVESALSALAPQINAILASYDVSVVWEMQTDP